MESTKKDKNGLLPFLKKFITKKIVVFLVSLIIIVIVIFGVNSAFQSDSKTVDIGLRNIGELATQVAYVTEVDVIDDPRTFFGVKIPFTRKGQILRSTPNTAPLICGACNTQPEGLSTMA